MTPAGPIEKRFDTGSVDEMTAWEIFLAFLTKLGVDVMTACDADIHISAGAERGVVLVTGFVKDEDGHNIVVGDEDDKHLKTYSNEYQFTRAWS